MHRRDHVSVVRGSPPNGRLPDWDRSLLPLVDPLTPPLPLPGVTLVAPPLDGDAPGEEPSVAEAPDEDATDAAAAPYRELDEAIAADLDQLELLLGPFTGADRCAVAASAYLDADGVVRSRRLELRLLR